MKEMETMIMDPLSEFLTCKPLLEKNLGSNPPCADVAEKLYLYDQYFTVDVPRQHKPA